MKQPLANWKANFFTGLAVVIVAVVAVVAALAVLVFFAIPGGVGILTIEWERAKG